MKYYVILNIGSYRIRGGGGINRRQGSFNSFSLRAAGLGFIFKSIFHSSNSADLVCGRVFRLFADLLKFRGLVGLYSLARLFFTAGLFKFLAGLAKFVGKRGILLM